ncbi:hypothetical protein PCE1_002129 [Barthelona sp. PCE]
MSVMGIKPDEHVFFPMKIGSVHQFPHLWLNGLVLGCRKYSDFISDFSKYYPEATASHLAFAKRTFVKIVKCQYNTSFFCSTQDLNSMLKQQRKKGLSNKKRIELEGKVKIARVSKQGFLDRCQNDDYLQSLYIYSTETHDCRSLCVSNDVYSTLLGKVNNSPHQITEFFQYLRMFSSGCSQLLLHQFFGFDRKESSRFIAEFSKIGILKSISYSYSPNTLSTARVDPQFIRQCELCEGINHRKNKGSVFKTSNERDINTSYCFYKTTHIPRRLLNTQKALCQQIMINSLSSLGVLSHPFIINRSELTIHKDNGVLKENPFFYIIYRIMLEHLFTKDKCSAFNCVPRGVLNFIYSQPRKQHDDNFEIINGSVGREPIALFTNEFLLQQHFTSVLPPTLDILTKVSLLPSFNLTTLSNLTMFSLTGVERYVENWRKVGRNINGETMTVFDTIKTKPAVVLQMTDEFKQYFSTRYSEPNIAATEQLMKSLSLESPLISSTSAVKPVQKVKKRSFHEISSDLLHQLIQKRQVDTLLADFFASLVSHLEIPGLETCSARQLDAFNKDFYNIGHFPHVYHYRCKPDGSIFDGKTTHYSATFDFYSLDPIVHTDVIENLPSSDKMKELRSKQLSFNQPKPIENMRKKDNPFPYSYGYVASEDRYTILWEYLVNFFEENGFDTTFSPKDIANRMTLKHFLHVTIVHRCIDPFKVYTYRNMIMKDFCKLIQSGNISVFDLMSDVTCLRSFTRLFRDFLKVEILTITSPLDNSITINTELKLNTDRLRMRFLEEEDDGEEYTLDHFKNDVLRITARLLDDISVLENDAKNKVSVAELTRLRMENRLLNFSDYDSSRMYVDRSYADLIELIVRNFRLSPTHLLTFKELRNAFLAFRYVRGETKESRCGEKWAELAIELETTRKSILELISEDDIKEYINEHDEDQKEAKGSDRNANLFRLSSYARYCHTVMYYINVLHPNYPNWRNDCYSQTISHNENIDAKLTVYFEPLDIIFGSKVRKQTSAPLKRQRTGYEQCDTSDVIAVSSLNLLLQSFGEYKIISDPQHVTESAFLSAAQACGNNIGHLLQCALCAHNICAPKPLDTGTFIKNHSKGMINKSQIRGFKNLLNSANFSFFLESFTNRKKEMKKLDRLYTGIGLFYHKPEEYTTFNQFLCHFSIDINDIQSTFFCLNEFCSILGYGSPFSFDDIDSSGHWEMLLEKQNQGISTTNVLASIISTFTDNKVDSMVANAPREFSVSYHPDSEWKYPIADSVNHDIAFFLRSYPLQFADNGFFNKLFFWNGTHITHMGRLIILAIVFFVQEKSCCRFSEIVESKYLSWIPEEYLGWFLSFLCFQNDDVGVIPYLRISSDCYILYDLDSMRLTSLYLNTFDENVIGAEKAFTKNMFDNL